MTEIVFDAPRVDDVTNPDDEVVELYSWFDGECGMCGADDLDGHEYSDGSIEYVCASCGARYLKFPDELEVQP